MRILTVVGARPQFIKASAISRCIREREGVEEIMVHTGQHYDENMSALFFRELGMPAPAIHLGIGSGRHGEQTARMLEALEKVLLEQNPNWVVVYGDTNSTLAGALAAAKLNVPLAHVEAGLRSFNRRMPEEVNRVVADHTADLLFAPTEEAMKNLQDEGVSDEKIVRVGDVMFDVALHMRENAIAQSRMVDQLQLRGRVYVLATVHRAENTDDVERLRAVMGGLEAISNQWPIVWPVHPRTKARLAAAGIDLPNGIIAIEPVGYLDMTALIASAALVATDSGGVQKEAFFHRVPCVTLREETEWVELVAMGWNRLVPPRNAELVAQGVRAVLEASPPSFPENSPYGDGHSAEHIVSRLAEQ